MTRTRWVLLRNILFLLVLAAFAAVFPRAGARVFAEDAGADPVPVYRLYYRPTHEHLFTTDSYEAAVLTTQGAWVNEGTGWTAPASGDPVRRLFHPATGEHLYTADQNEYETLPTYGWRQEGICWYSAEADAMPVYRLFSPHLTIGAHFYTPDAGERAALLQSGLWQDEGIAWTAAGGGAPGPVQEPAQLFIENLAYETGTFDMVLRGASAPGGVQKVVFLAWHDGDMGSIFWYDAFRQDDGSWRVTANYENHRGIRGLYRVQAFVFGGDGVADLAGETEVDDPFRDVFYDPLVQRARAAMAYFVPQDLTREQKLRVCFDSFRGKQEYNPWIPHYHGEDWVSRYANYYFDTQTGNCYAYATAFGYMAKALGYENVYACSGYSHGWIEIDGMIFDPELAKHYSDVSYYGMPYGVYRHMDYYRQLGSDMPYNRVKL